MWKPNLEKYNGPKYISIANALCDDIRSGKLKPGDKLPPQRELSYELNINFGTVTKAYALASKRGLVRGEIGRGTFVRKKPPSSKTPWPNEDKMPGRIDMRSDFPCILTDDPVFTETFKQLGIHPNLSQLFQYQPGASIPDHLEIASYWLNRLGIEASADQILITNGALHGGFLSLMALAKPGDQVLTDTMTSPAIRSIAAMLNLRLKPVAMDERGMIPDDLEEKLKQNDCKALYLIPNFHNPTASIMPLERRLSIAEIAERFGIYLVEDDVFGSLIEKRIKPISSLIPERSFYITSFSKGIAPGLRVGYLVPPEQCHHRALTGLRVTTWMASPIMVEMVSRWVKDGNASRLISLQTSKIAQRVTIVRERLKDFSIQSHPFCPHMWLRLPASVRESEAVILLSQRGIDTTPGEVFSVGSGYVPGGLRLCLGQIENLDALKYACKIILKTLLETPSHLYTEI